MAISIYPTPSTSSINASSYTVAAINTQYRAIQDFNTGVYTISTNPTTANATVIFYNNSSIILTASTTSGIVS